MAGVALDPATNGTLTDVYLQTTIPGIFSCGNCRKVMDLADFVTTQGLAAGRNAARFLQKQSLKLMPRDSNTNLPKGLPQPGVVTCVLCPRGCRVRLRPDGMVKGNACEKGEAYARQEATAPLRLLTTTMKRQDGSLLPVKSSRPLPRERLLPCAARLREITLPEGSIPCGRIVLDDPFGMGVDILAAQ